MGSWVLILFGIMALLFAFFFLGNLKLWIMSKATGAPISMMQIMRLRSQKMDSELLVTQYILSQKAGLPVTLDQLEDLSQAKGNVAPVVQAMICANEAGIDLDFEKAMTLDLKGHDTLALVNQSVKAGRTELVM